jgi:hypothetical protein
MLILLGSVCVAVFIITLFGKELSRVAGGLGFVIKWLSIGTLVYGGIYFILFTLGIVK